MRMDPANKAALDFYLFPCIDLVEGRSRLAEENGLGIDAYRFDDLTELFGMAARIPFAVAA